MVMSFLFPLALASLLDDRHSQLQQLLDDIPSVTTIVVNLEYMSQVLPPTCQSVCTECLLSAVF